MSAMDVVLTTEIIAFVFCLALQHEQKWATLRSRRSWQRKRKKWKKCKRNTPANCSNTRFVHEAPLKLFQTTELSLRVQTTEEIRPKANSLRNLKDSQSEFQNSRSNTDQWKAAGEIVQIGLCEKVDHGGGDCAPWYHQPDNFVWTSKHDCMRFALFHPCLLHKGILAKRTACLQSTLVFPGINAPSMNHTLNLRRWKCSV